MTTPLRSLACMAVLGATLGFAVPALANEPTPKPAPAAQAPANQAEMQKLHQEMKELRAKMKADREKIEAQYPDMKANREKMREMRERMRELHQRQGGGMGMKHPGIGGPGGMGPDGTKGPCMGKEAGKDCPMTPSKPDNGPEDEDR